MSKGRLSIFQSIYPPTLNFGDKLWAVTERMTSPIHVAKMSFHCRVGGLGGKLRRSDIRRELVIEPPSLVERSLIKMPPGPLPLKVFHTHQTERRPCGRPAGGIIIWPGNTFGSSRSSCSVLLGRHLGYFTQSDASATRFRINGRKLIKHCLLKIKE